MPKFMEMILLYIFNELQYLVKLSTRIYPKILINIIRSTEAVHNETKEKVCKDIWFLDFFYWDHLKAKTNEIDLFQRPEHSKKK